MAIERLNGVKRPGGRERHSLGDYGPSKTQDESLRSGGRVYKKVLRTPGEK